MLGRRHGDGEPARGRLPRQLEERTAFALDGDGLRGEHRVDGGVDGGVDATARWRGSRARWTGMAADLAVAVPLAAPSRAQLAAIGSDSDMPASPARAGWARCGDLQAFGLQTDPFGGWHSPV
jgi:L-rhamnose isomerase